MKINSYMVYFRCSDGGREGIEIIYADSKEEAIRIYQTYFNVKQGVIAVPRIDTKVK